MTRLLVTCIVVIAAGAAVFAWTASVDDGGDSAVALSSGQQEVADQLASADGVAIESKGGLVTSVRGGGAVDDQLAAEIGKLTSLRTLDLTSSPVTEDGLASLAGLADLESLWLDGVKLTPAGVQALQQLTGLRELSLATCELGPDVLAQLSGLNGLESLDLSDTSLSDEDLQHFSKLPALQRLYLKNTSVTGSGLAKLESRNHLTLVQLAGAPVDDGLASALVEMPALEMLYLEQTPIDDVLVEDLVDALVANTPDIRGLFLDGTKLTDASIPALTRLNELSSLAAVRIAQTEITRPSFEELAASAPEIRFAYGSGGIEAD